MYDRTQKLWRKAWRVAFWAVVAGSFALWVLAPRGEALAAGWMLGGAASMLRYRMRYRALLRAEVRGRAPLVLWSPTDDTQTRMAAIALGMLCT